MDQVVRSGETIVDNSLSTVVVVVNTVNTINVVNVKSPSQDNGNNEIRDGAPRSSGNDDGSCNANIVGQEIRNKTDKIREVVEQAANEDSKNKVDKLLEEVHQLTDLEKLLLYLRLPTGTTVDVDPLKQAFITSLGNRYEVTQTVTWIQTHLEEDNEVSLPKQEVYDGYCEFCQRVKMKPLSTADFGKVMKQVFPGVRPRRLGTRGNSRYCYAGLRKKLLLTSPQLPDLSLTHEETCEDGDPSDPVLTGVSSHLVREWAEKLLGQKFSNLRELACHLVDYAYVNNRSVAAFTLLSYLSSNGLGKRNQSCILMNQSAGSKHRETQLQLQRKIHERELIREQKRKLMEQRSIQVAGLMSPTASEIKGRKSNQLPKTPSFDDQLRTPPTCSTSLEKGPRSKSFDFIDSTKTRTTTMTTNLFKEKQGENSKKPKTVRRETAVRLFQAKSTPATSTSSPSKCEETMRSRSSSDCIRPGNTMACVSSIGEHQSSIEFSNRAPELFRTSSLGAAEAASKTGKVRIPRLIFPRSVDYNRASPGSQIKPKYKRIQPKPMDLCTSSLDETSTAKTLILTTISTVTVDSEKINNDSANLTIFSDMNQQNGRENTAGSQVLISSDTVINETSEKKQSLSPRSSPSSADSKRNFLEKSSIPTSVQKGSRDSNRPSRRDRCKQIKRTTTETKRNQKAKNKRLCLPSFTDGQSTMVAVSANDKKEGVGPEGEMSISTLENDAWMEYLEGGVPSVEQEDELLHYFGGDDVLSPIKRDFTSSLSGGAQSTELSQLRRLLERNLLQRAASNRDDPVDKPIASADSMPTLRLLLSSTRQQQLNMEAGDGITSDSCLSHASSRMPSPILATPDTRSPPLPPTPYFASTSATQEENSRLDIREIDTGLMLDSSMEYVQDMTREDVWSSQESYNVVKAATGNSQEPMFSSSDSSSGCHAVGNTSNSFQNSTAVHFENRSGSSHHLNTGEPFNGGFYLEINTSYNSSQQQPHQQQQQPQQQQRQQQQHPGHHQLQVQRQTGFQSQTSSVPPSPNTRRRAFNFMPISPRNTPVLEACSSATHSASHSPLFFSTSNNASTSGCHGTARSTVTHTAPSLSASTATSPFVSPRSTPSSHCRSRHNSGQPLSGTPRATPHSLTYFNGSDHHHLHHHQQQQQQLPSLTSSPFASPHPTPVSFSRSRHNSTQNVQRTCSAALLYGSSATRTRHASDICMTMPMMISSPCGSAPLSPLDLHKEIDSSVMRLRHDSNSSIPPNSPACSSAPMSPMVVHCQTQDQVGSPGYVTSQQHHQHRQFHPTSDLERMTLNDDDFNLNYRQDVILQNQACTNWHLRQLPTLQIDPRLASRQRHASMGATVHHHPLPPPPRPPSSTEASISATPINQSTNERRHFKKSPPPPLSSLDAVSASRCRSVPIYQMLENAIKLQPESTFISLTSQVDSSSYSSVILSKSYPATPIGQQQSFSFDTQISSVAHDYSPMVGGNGGGGGGGEGGGGESGSGSEVVGICGVIGNCVKIENVDPMMESVAVSGVLPTQTSNGDGLEMPANEFQDMLNTTLADLTYEDDISKFAQELEQYTQQ